MVRGGLVEVIPHTKGLGVMYSFHWGYGCVFGGSAGGVAPTGYRSGLWPSFLALDCSVGDRGEVGVFGGFGDWGLVKL